MVTWCRWPHGELQREISIHTEKELVEVQTVNEWVRMRSPGMGATREGEGAAQAEISGFWAEA